MPCLYKMEVKDSGIHGKGFFSLENIPKGAVYWVFEDPNPKPVEGYHRSQTLYTQKKRFKPWQAQRMLKQ